MSCDDREIEKDFQIGSLSPFNPYTNNQKSSVPALNISSSPRYTIALSPAIIGERLVNEFNLELRELSFIIQFITGKNPSIHFLNMQEGFLQLLSTGDNSDFINTSILSIMKDALFYKNPSQIDHLSSKRGLKYTIYGIHLNSNGAMIVAGKYGEYIEELL
ncbi:MAG: hypothetical protein ACQEWF_01230 [Bacillota bacterium]